MTHTYHILEHAESKQSLSVDLANVDLPGLNELGYRVQEGTCMLTISAMPEEAGGGLQLVGQVRVALEAFCQRCLDPMPLGIDRAIRWWTNSSMADQTTDGWVWLDSDLTAAPLDRWIEEELLLALPMVTKHEAVDLCASNVVQWLKPVADLVEEKNTQQPFAELEQSLKQATASR